MAVGILPLLLLLFHRRWPEAVYVGIGLWALGASYWHLSIPRTSLLWWPLWTGLEPAARVGEGGVCQRGGSADGGARGGVHIGPLDRLTPHRVADGSTSVR